MGYLFYGGGLGQGYLFYSSEFMGGEYIGETRCPLSLPWEHVGAMKYSRHRCGLDDIQASMVNLGTYSWIHREASLGKSSS